MEDSFTGNCKGYFPKTYCNFPQVPSGEAGCHRGSRRNVQSDPSDTRFYIAHLLSQLKAVETLDLIVRELDQKGLLPSMLSLNTAPMVDAIVGFGEAAVPYLEKALAVERLSLKQKACIALGEIGGAKAKRCLERALQRESDQDVIWFIKDGLQEIVRKRFVKERRASP